MSAIRLDEYRRPVETSEADLIYGRGMTLRQFDRALRSEPPPTACSPAARDVSEERPGASAEARFGALDRDGAR